MKITYQCPDGSDTEAERPSVALMHWLGRQMPLETPKDQVFAEGLMRVGPPVPGPRHPNFFTAVYAAIERRWNKTPHVKIPEPNALIAVYEARCAAVLTWLSEHGDILNLHFDMKETRREDEDKREEGV